MNEKLYKFTAPIKKDDVVDGAYVEIPFDIKAEFGKGRVPVHATFDDEPYDGSAVNMGVKNPDGTICYIIGLRKDIRSKIGKQPGDMVNVSMKERGNSMWVCEKCNRSFKNTNQDHYCGAGPSVIDDYIEQAPEEHRQILRLVRETIRAAAPDSVEKISWQMPTFWQGENLIHFAAFKNHLGLYPGDDGVRAFTERLTNNGYKFSKGTIQIPWNQPIPYGLITEITQYRVQQAVKNKSTKGKPQR